MDHLSVGIAQRICCRSRWIRPAFEPLIEPKKQMLRSWIAACGFEHELPDRGLALRDRAPNSLFGNGDRLTERLAQYRLEALRTPRPSSSISGNTFRVSAPL